MKKYVTTTFLSLILFIFTSCNVQETVLPLNPTYPPTGESIALPSLTPFQPLKATEVTALAAPSATTAPTATPVPISESRLWISGSVPVSLAEQMKIMDANLKMALSAQDGNLFLDVVEQDSILSRWVYVLVAPFPTVLDGVELQDIKKAWHGGTVDEPDDSQSLLMTQNTRAAFTRLWGEPSEIGVKVVQAAALLEKSWKEPQSWAIIPFEDLQPRWKVLKVGGVSPLDIAFDMKGYPLVVSFGLRAEKNNKDLKTSGLLALPESNRDAGKLTVLVMTGTTALVRATGERMESKGMTYPALDIQNWLRDADLTHISNEVSFSKDCPPADPYQRGLRFCSRPEYIELLEFIGVDIVELTGNHILDWSREALSLTLDLYQQHNWDYYGGGKNLEEARKPLKIEHNGNRLAFIGCNLVGPPGVWAQETVSGNAACEDYAWVMETIKRVKSDGYLPIVTLQHNEFYYLTITPNQEQDFIPLSDAGAVIVSGSQAHYPNPFGFGGSGFIHYGLGNLFFDQMDVFIQPGIQREFIDRHVFYDGKYISVEILTAHLEDFARPRPMTVEERAAFLEEAFKASGW